MPVQEAAVMPRHIAKTITFNEQPVLTAGEVVRPEMQPNPLAMREEPTVLEHERMPPPSYKSIVPRTVVEADLVEFFAWGMPRFLKIYPRAREELVRPWLMACMKSPLHRFVRTESAFGLFYAEKTPWEPELAVYDQFVVARHDVGKDRAEALEAPNIWKEGCRWAQDIGAVTYQFGCATGIDITPIAERIGYNYGAQGFVKVLHRRPSNNLFSTASPTSTTGSGRRPGRPRKNSTPAPTVRG